MACSPVTNWTSQQFASQIPTWRERFLGEALPQASGVHFTRSPLHAAARVGTPVLLVCGALDRNTPPTQALEMYQALRCLGKPARLLTYPLEGHGIRGAAAGIDYAARTLPWFMTHRRS
jgi:dipeptidyl aminopeptidase/acylaminoacyl peptidase